MVQAAKKPPTMAKFQPCEYKNTGTPTTNHTSRAPNKATRAAASPLMPAFLANSSLADFDALALPIIGGTAQTTPMSTKTNKAAISQSEWAKPKACSITPPKKKPRPFMAFLLPVNHATHLKSWLLPPSSALAWACVILMADLLAVLVKSLATPQMPCAITTQATDIAMVQLGSSKESNTNPLICVSRPTVSMRWMPKRVANQPPIKLATMPAASYSRNKKAKANGE